MWSLPSCLESDSIPPESTSRSVTKHTNHSSRASRALHQKANPISDAHSRNEAKSQQQREASSFQTWLKHRERGGGVEIARFSTWLPSFQKPSTTFQAAHHTDTVQTATPYNLHTFIKQFPGISATPQGLLLLLFCLVGWLFFLCYPLPCRVNQQNPSQTRTSHSLKMHGCFWRHCLHRTWIFLRFTSLRLFLLYLSLGREVGGPIGLGKEAESMMLKTRILVHEDTALTNLVDTPKAWPCLVVSTGV